MTEILVISKDDKIKAIAKWYKDNDYNLKYDLPNISDDIVDKLYEILVNNKIPEITDETDQIIMHIAGNYMNVNKNYTEMIKYYEMGIKKKNIGSTINLALYYEKNGDIVKMLEYLKMGVEWEDVDSAYLCYKHYLDNKDYPSAIKYCEIAMDLGCVDAIYDMGIIHSILGNKKDADKYFAMAEHAGNLDVLIMHGQTNINQKNFRKAFEYYQKAYTHHQSTTNLELMQEIQGGMLFTLNNDKLLFRDMTLKYIESCKIKEKIDEMNEFLSKIENTIQTKN